MNRRTGHRRIWNHLALIATLALFFIGLQALAQDAKPLLLLGPADWPTSVAISPDGTTIASASRDKGVRLWSADSGKLKQTLEGHTDTVQTVSFHPEGKLLASAGYDGTIRVWDVSTGKSQMTLRAYTGSAWFAHYSPDGTLLVSGGFDRPVSDAAVYTVQMWDSTNGKLLWRKELEAMCAAFSPDGKSLALGAADGKIRIWRTDNAEETKTIRISDNHPMIYAVAFSKDGRLLACGSDLRIVQVWDTRKWKEVATLRGHTSKVGCVAFHPDGKTLASGGPHGARLWDAATGQTKRILPGNNPRLLPWTSALEWSPDGKTLAVAGIDSVGVWKFSAQ